MNSSENIFSLSMEDSLERSIPLHPSQAVRIHGWMKPVRRLYWKAHVLARQDLLFSTLVDKMGLCNNTLASLHHLQPNIHAWIHSKKVVLEDCEIMHPFWDVHPLRDFHVQDGHGIHPVKIGEILQAGLSFDALLGCKVTLEELAKAGLNPSNMKLFCFSLYQWKQLGFTYPHAACMSSSQVENVFGIPKHVLEASFINE